MDLNWEQALERAHDPLIPVVHDQDRATSDQAVALLENIADLVDELRDGAIRRVMNCGKMLTTFPTMAFATIILAITATTILGEPRLRLAAPTRP